MPRKTVALRSSLIVFVLINIAWLGLVALWIYYSLTNYQAIRALAIRFDFGSGGIGTSWGVLFGVGTLMLFLLLGVIVLYVYFRKQAGLNLLQQNFISSVTHELKSPLASLNLYIETLALRDPGDEDRRAFLSRMQEETERLSSLIDNILFVSRIERFKVEYSFKPISLSEELRAYVEHKMTRHGWSADQCIADIAPGVTVVADWENLRVAFDNIVENAVKYSPEGFWLAVRLRVKGAFCTIAFEDKGIGIPPEHQKKIFRMFYRVGGGAYRGGGGQGTGLGLYIVRNVVQAHGGRVTARSEGRGKGTTFLVELPLEGPRSGRRRPEFWLSSLPFRRS